MASCFLLRMVLFSGFILFVFLSHHLSNVSVLPAISQGKREELGKRKVWSHLTCSSTGPDSPALALATLFSPRNFQICVSSGQRSHAAVLGWAESLRQLCSSLGNPPCTTGVWRVSTGTNLPLTGTVSTLPRLNNWRIDKRREKFQLLCIAFAVCAVYLISISAVGGGGKEEDNKE